MNVENTATPDTSSGHGSMGTPDAASGHGEQTNTGNGTVNPNQASPGSDYEARYQDLRNSFNQKITEMGQLKSQLQQQLQSLQQQQEQRNQALAQALGFAQQEQEQDIVSQLIDNPNLLQEMIQQEANRVVEPLQQKLVRKETNEFLTNQNYEKELLKQELSNTMSSEMINQVLDISSSLSPEVMQIQQKLQNPYLNADERNNLEFQLETKVADHIRQAGGIRKLVYSKLGELTATNFQGLMQDGAQILRQKQMSMGRTGGASGFSNGAGTQQGSSTYRSQSIFR